MRVGRAIAGAGTSASATDYFPEFRRRPALRFHFGGGGTLDSGPSRPNRVAQPFTSISSTSKTSVAFGGMTPPAPRSP
jgi:hypothetical protein